ncbi:MAG: histidine triad nucleotide-binding protein [Negativicutes bacterium]|nr:histidine triad nucleotide-binding protein [Negativicutes bacterium]
MQDCIFCKIVNKEIPVKAIYEDEQIIAFSDINPVAPVHILVITKKHIANLLDTSPDDAALLGHMMMKIPEIAEIAGVSRDGFRVVFNTKDNGGQTVYHLHGHILGGRFMKWPPG